MIFPPIARRAPKSAGTIHIVVDLSGLRPGGENGGLKPFLLRMLRWLSSQKVTPLIFTYLIWSEFEEELRELLRPEDRIICVVESRSASGKIFGTWRTGTHLSCPPPPDLGQQLGADVIYAALTKTEFYCPGIPVVTLVADLLHRDFPSSLSQLEIARREAQFAEITQRSNYIQCLSQFGVDRLRFHYPVSDGRVFFTYPTLDPLSLAPESRISAHIADGPFFFYPGNAWHHKNHEVLLAGYDIYCRRAGPNPWPLVLTGFRDENMEAVLALAASRGLTDNVRYLGFLGPAEHACLWRQAGALIFASRYEGFGIPLIEAMNFGVPIVASRSSAVSEVAGDAALFFEGESPDALCTALCEITTLRDTRERLVAAGRRRARKFAITVEGPKFLDCLTRAVHESVAPFCRGVLPNGWFDQRLIAGLLPRRAKQTAEFRISAAPKSTRIRIYHDQNFYCSAVLDPGAETVLKIVVPARVRTLTIEAVAGPNGGCGPDRERARLRLHELAIVARGMSGKRQKIFDAECSDFQS